MSPSLASELHLNFASIVYFVWQGVFVSRGQESREIGDRCAPLDFFRPRPSLSITSSAHRIRLEPAVADGARKRRISDVGSKFLDCKSGDDCVVVAIVALVVGWVGVLEAAVFGGGIVRIDGRAGKAVLMEFGEVGGMTAGSEMDKWIEVWFGGDWVECRGYEVTFIFSGTKC